MPARTLRWEGCANVRDLGGLPTEDGGETRFGAVVRSDNVRQLSDNGWRCLRAYGIRRIVDLRWDDELAMDGRGNVEVEVRHVPLFGERHTFREIDALTARVTGPVEWRQLQYVTALDRYAANFARAVAAVAQAPDGAVLVHCAGGVDRTGLVAALLLRLADVGRDHIADDYAASEAAWAATVEDWIAAADTEEERTRRRMLSVIRAETMSGVLDRLEAAHGGVDAYLRGAGVDASDLDAIRTRLRG